MQSTVMHVGFVLVAVVTVASAAHFQDCGSVTGQWTQIDISGCKATDKECILRKNTETTIKITFQLHNATNEVKVIVHGIILGVEIPFSLRNPDGCRDSGLICPLVEGSTNSYETSFPISSSYPAVKVDVKFELRDHDDNDIVCVKIPAKIR